MILLTLSRYQMDEFRKLAPGSKSLTTVANSDLHVRLLQCRYNKSTRLTYNSGMKKFHSFCRQDSFISAPASSLTLQYFCAHVSQFVSYKTVKVYLAAIRLHHIEHNLSDPTTDNLLHLVCRGIHRLQGDSQSIRLPITINLMHTIKEQLRQSTYTVQEQRMLWTAFTTAFYDFLRVSKLVGLHTVGATFPSHLTIFPSFYSCQKWTLSDMAVQLKSLPPNHPHAHTMLLTVTVN